MPNLVEMPNLYATVAELKASVAIGDVADDNDIELALESASRMIDDYAGRHFYLEVGLTTRYYVSEHDLVIVDDVQAGALVAFGTADTPYTADRVTTMYPLNSAAEGRPYTQIRGSIRAGELVSVTGDHGWLAVPPAIRQATRIQAARLFQRRNAPFGITGSPEMGQMRLLNRLDPDVEMLVAPFVRHWSCA